MDFRRLARLEIVNPRKFLSALRIFLNTKRVLEILNEKEINLQITRGNPKQEKIVAHILGKMRGLLGEVNLTKLGGEESSYEKTFLDKIREELSIPKLTETKPITSSFDEYQGLAPSLFIAEVYISPHLPEEFLTIFKSFLLSYTDSGPMWNNIL